MFLYRENRTAPRRVAVLQPEVPTINLSIETLCEKLQSHIPEQVAAPGARLAAVAAVLAPTRSGVELLLMKRIERANDPWSGQISLPGGHFEPEDSSAAETARRETLEETGLLLEDPPIAQLDDIHPQTPLLPSIVIRPFVFALSRTAPPLTLGPEAALEIRVLLDELFAKRAIKTLVIRGNLLTTEGFEIGPHFLWGLTDRVIANLKSAITG